MVYSVQQVFIVTIHLILLSLARHQKRTEVDVLKHSWDDVQLGVCSYGQTTSCCFGQRNVGKICQPVCRKSCVHGKCVRGNKCSCFTGFRGPHCDEDVNECGFLERPCSQRCMNTPGSYRCYCDSGYTLSSDGCTCIRETTCFSLRCQFGCQLDSVGTLGCLCPRGLLLASDNKTCEDINECQGGGVCPPRRTCRNTFGSFVCVCRDGFVMGTTKGASDCQDKNECLIGSHKCSRHARCINTDGSYICRCSEDFIGNGHTCWPRRAPQSMAVMFSNYKRYKRTRYVHHQCKSTSSDFPGPT